MTFLLRNRLFKKDKVQGDDYDDTFALQKCILSWLGLHMTHKISEFRSKCWSCYYWLLALSCVLSIVSEMAAMVVTANNARSFEDVLKNFLMMPCLGSCYLAIVKSVKIKWNREMFEKLYYDLRDIWPRGEVTDTEQCIISKSVKFFNIILKGFYWSNHILLALFLLPSFIASLSRHLGYDVEIILPFAFWTPFDQFQPIVHEGMLLFQTWAATTVIWWNVVSDMLFCTYLLHITMQLDLLAARVQRLVYVPVNNQLIETYPLAALSKEMAQEEKDSTFDRRNKEMGHEKKLIEIVTRHQILIRLACHVEELFSFGMLVNFVYSSVIICFCGFCSVLIEKWNEVAYKSYLIVVLSQTWLLCWYGQQLLDSSERLSNALYECGWYNASKNIKRSILIMLQRSQKAIRVTTYGFSVISLSSYSTIIKSSWSYFTLLLNLYTNIGDTDASY